MKILFTVLIVLFLVSRLLATTQVHQNAKIVLANAGCPVKLDETGRCVVFGTLSRSFLKNEIEIELADKSVLILQAENLVGYSTDAKK